MNNIYFDNAATTALDADVIEVMTQSMKGIYGNPSSMHQFGRTSKTAVEKCRKNIAKMLNVTASEIIFTGGGSEADNLIIRNAVCHLGVKRIVTSKIEHHAVLYTIEDLERNFNLEVCYVNVDSFGNIDLVHLEAILKDSTSKTLVSLMFVNNEIGTILDVNRVSELCQENDALFHSDAVQAIGHYKVDLRVMPIDFVAASAHKFHGPKGVGFAYFRKGFGIKPILTGGAQERGARAGTENVAGIVGMDKALEVFSKNLEKDITYISELKTYFMDQIEIHIPGVLFNGNPRNLETSNYSILSVRFPKVSAMLLFALDLKGIAASGGSACQSGSLEGSHVLNAILSVEEAQKTSIRFSFCKYNSKDEIDFTIKVLKETLMK